jgi:hypothetical protein
MINHPWSDILLALAMAFMVLAFACTAIAFV